MRKILFFALALVAGVLAFTSCEKKNADNPLVGTWVYEDGEQGEFHFKHAITIGNNSDFEYTLKALYDEENVHFSYTWDGDYAISGDTVTIHFKHMTWHQNWDAENFETHTEQFVYTIDGNRMTLRWLDDGGYDRPTELIKQ